MARAPQELVGRPVPEPDESLAVFFAGARQGHLMVQRCGQCRAFLAPGSALCSECLGESLEWVEASGKGTLFTFAVVHQPYHPGFAKETPYNIAVVELDEGPRLNTNIVGVPNEKLRVGMRLVATFERLAEDVYIPKFRPAPER